MAPPLAFELTVVTTPTSVTSTDSPDFGAAVQAGAEEQVPLAERANTIVITTINEIKTIVVTIGALNMGIGADRVTLVMTLQEAACKGMDGTCYMTLVERRNRALQAANTATISSTRGYSYTTSPNASIPIQTLIAGSIGSLGGGVSSVTNTGLSASTTVTTQGTAAASGVPAAFATPTQMTNQIALRLPNVGTTVSAPVVVAPPYPPPPPPPSPPPPPPPPDGSVSSAGGQTVVVYINNGTNTVTRTVYNTTRDVVSGGSDSGGDSVLSYGFGLATGLAAVACFLVGFIVATRYRNRRAGKGDNRVVPHSIDEAKSAPPADAAGGHESSDDEMPVDGAKPLSRVPTQHISRVPTQTLAAQQPWASTPRASEDASYPAEPPPPVSAPPPPPTGSSNVLGSIFSDQGTADAAPGFDTSSPAAPPSVQRTNTGRLMVAPAQADGPVPALGHGHMPNRSAPKLVSSASMAAFPTEAVAAEPSLSQSSSMAYCSNYGIKRPSGALVASSRLSRSVGDQPPSARPSGVMEGSQRPASARLPPMIGGVAVPDARATSAQGSVRLSSNSKDSARTSSPDRDSKPARIAPQLATGEAKQAWQRGSIKVSATRAVDISRSRTMFDDGRFLRSVVDEARTEGLTPARAGPSSPDGSQAPPPTQMLRKMTSKGLAREPETNEMMSGFEGGGGVRLHPPHLDEALATDLASCFVPATQHSTTGSAHSTWVKGAGQ